MYSSPQLREQLKRQRERSQQDLQDRCREIEADYERHQVACAMAEALRRSRARSRDPKQET